MRAALGIGWIFVVCLLFALAMDGPEAHRGHYAAGFLFFVLGSIVLWVLRR